VAKSHSKENSEVKTGMVTISINISSLTGIRPDENRIPHEFLGKFQSSDVVVRVPLLNHLAAEMAEKETTSKK